MNLSTLLFEREAVGRPVTVGLIGAGKFGAMFLAQARLTRGLHVLAVADLNVARAKSQLQTAGWPAEQFAAASLGDALKQCATHINGTCVPVAEPSTASTADTSTKADHSFTAQRCFENPPIHPWRWLRQD